MPHHCYPLVCPLDCPGACALEVTVADGRIHAIRGRGDHPFTQGLICGKVSRYRDLQEGPRILYPMIRTGAKGSGQFRRASWDESLDLVARRLETIMKHTTPEAVFPFFYGGTMGIVQRGAIERLTHRAGFSRMSGTICYPIGFSGWQAGVGRAVGPDPSEMATSDLVILWGIDAAVTHISLMGHVKKARNQGGRLIVVDPYRSRTARLADDHIQPRPGTDGALAVAMMGVLLREGLADADYLARRTDFDPLLDRHLREKPPEWAADITGMDPETIRSLARRLGTARAPFIRIGLGMSRQFNGAVNVHAVSCLAAMTGAWDRPGGGALFATGDAFHIQGEPVRQTRLMAQPSRILDMSRLGPMLTGPNLDPPIGALLVFNANPAASCPDLNQVHRGLLREDLFVVVHEQVMSDTARFADVLWPATTFLEEDDLYKSYGQYTLQIGKGCLPPRGEARCNHDVVNALAMALGYNEAAFQGTSLERIDQVLAASDYPPRETWENQGWLDCRPPREERQFTTAFPTADGRFHFYPHWTDPAMPSMPDHWPVNARDRQPPGNPYPLDFITPPSLDTLNSTFAHLPEGRRTWEPPRLWIHPEDARSRNIEDGQWVSVTSATGRLTLKATWSDAVRPGLTLCHGVPRGSMFREGISLNALTSADSVAPVGGAAFHDNRVEVTALDPASVPASGPDVAHSSENEKKFRVRSRFHGDGE
ncbi:MAG: molybdopterin-dependent oxidoreductase [Magnetococcales bacterium]|nr:molybdopterin-dependent oxidoreductase [Magnetococcales bacterium]